MNISLREHIRSKQGLLTYLSLSSSKIVLTFSFHSFRVIIGTYHCNIQWKMQDNISGFKKSLSTESNDRNILAPLLLFPYWWI